MAVEEIKVTSMPTQRSINDVALELTQLYYKNIEPNNVEELQEAYAKLYAIAITMVYGKKNAYVNTGLIPDDLINKIP